MHSYLVVALLVELISTISACVSIDAGGPPSRNHGGPPAHAPAHGYRHNHHGQELVFDRDLDVYVVIGVRDVWFLDGTYFRISSDGRWEISVGVEGPWRSAVGSTVPVRLQERRHPHGGPPGLLKKRAY